MKRFKESDVWLRLYVGPRFKSVYDFHEIHDDNDCGKDHLIPWACSRKCYRFHRQYLDGFHHNFIRFNNAKLSQVSPRHPISFIYDQNSREASDRNKVKVEIISRGQNYSGVEFLIRWMDLPGQIQHRKWADVNHNFVSVEKPRKLYG